ncbi:MAG: M24 family metallopeptidase [Planctomycetes bacterium]|nr:M24 family metallopeptidase [Planctomycetota bacterium]
MTALVYSQTEPVSSEELPVTDPQRSADIEHKQRLVADFLQSHQYDALLLQKPENFSWFTSGGNCARSGSSEPTASLFITPEARVVVTANSNSAQLFERELPGLGFQLKERDWSEPRHALVEDLCRGRTVASDSGIGGTHDVSVQLTAMQLPLTAVECKRMRELGRLVAHAVEAACRACRPGQTEAEIAGNVAHRLIKRQVIPERIQIMADGRSARFRHWGYGSDRVDRVVTVAVVGRRWGLCLGAARTVSFGNPSSAIDDAYQRAVLVHAAGIYFSQPEWELFEIWNRIQRIYEKNGLTDEWRLAEQAEVIGYRLCEIPLVANSEFRLTPQMAVHWHPSVGPAVLGDSILVSQRKFELLTPMENWPSLKVEVKGVRVDCPAILRRAMRDDSAADVPIPDFGSGGDSVLE